MKKIFKYKIPFSLENAVCILMPQKAEILSTGAQKDELFIWALVDENEGVENRYFQVHATGETINNIERKKFVGTIFSGHYVWHLFEIID